jgi:hypothetical protein
MPPPPLFPIAPAGITPAATWDPIYRAAIRQPVVMVPKLDPTSGEQFSLVEGDDPTYQAIAAEFRTVLGSGSAVPNFGHKLLDIKKNDVSAPTEIKFEVDRILKPYIARRLIKVDDLQIVAGPEAGSRASITLMYTVLQTKQQKTLEVIR